MPANKIFVVLKCPRCGIHGEVEVEARLDGQGFSNDYRVGERIDWLPTREPEEGGRPPDGDLTVDGYAVCEACEKDFFVTVTIVKDYLVGVRVDVNRPGYIA